MITAVDTNIIIDILEPDPRHGLASRDRLKQCRLEGAIVACEVVWAEVVTAYGSSEEQVVEVLDQIDLVFDPISKESALAAARSWHAYRVTGRGRSRIAADFLIGAHATVQCDRLLTRDRGFYREFFGGLDVLDPSPDRGSNA